MMVSPGSSRSASACTVSSVMWPAGTITHTTRGAGSAATRASSEAPAIAPSPASRSIAAGSTSLTTTSWPSRINRRVRLAPIRPSPTIPIFMRPSLSSTQHARPWRRAAYAEVMPQDYVPATADALVIFGVTGDLAHKMTFRALYRLERRDLLTGPVIGGAREDWSSDRLRTEMEAAIVASGESVEREVMDRLKKRVTCVSGDYTEADTYVRLKAALSSSKAPVFYLEIPPALFGQVVSNLAEQDLTKNARVVVEKPFGHDLASAQQLSHDLRRVLD